MAEPEITKEMVDKYIERTNKHIGLVRKYGNRIHQLDKERFPELPQQLAVHDDSKFEEPEYTPYILITRRYKLKAEGKTFEVSEEMEKKMLKASEHHVKTNSHHPEYHDKSVENPINPIDRDKPKELINATTMPDVDIAEMVADWCAMGEELGNSPKEWADNNVGVRWKFTEDQTNLIYELILSVWR